MFSLRLITIPLLTLSFAACMEGAQPPTETSQVADPSGPAVTDTERPAASHKDAAPVANLGAPGEIAFGTINTAGAKITGTSNWTSTLNASLTRYEITITGESYFFSSYATTATPMGASGVSCNTNSVSGKLLISCVDLSGTLVSPLIAFVTFKP
jgi:hypothetical protein